MKKSTIRAFFRRLLEKPRNRFDKVLGVWDRAIWLGWSGIITTVAFATNNVSTILFIIWFFIGGFIIFYFFFARGR